MIVVFLVQIYSDVDLPQLAGFAGTLGCVVAASGARTTRRC